MEQSQVRWAILLSRAPLKVRRLHSLPLLWAAAGPDCRSLKLYWVSAKALTLPISQHASSQLSLPSGLRPSPERINISSPCSRYARAMCLLKSWARSILTLSLFWGPMWCHFLTPIKDWEFIVRVILPSGAPAQSSTISGAPDQIPTHLITDGSHWQGVTCQTLSICCNPRASTGMWRCDGGV